MSRCRNLEPNEKHTQKKVQIQASALQRRTLRDLFFFLAVLCFFCSPPLDLCSSFVTPPNESAAFHRGRRRRRHSRRRALLSHYLITAAASKEGSTFGCVTFGGTRDIHGGAGVFDRGSCPSSANGKSGCRGAGAESRVRIGTSAKLSAKVASL